MPINHWPLNERPREKLFLVGAKNLSDAELLAIFLNTGIRGKTALDIARELLVHFGSLKKLLDSPVHLLNQMPGVGKAKFALFQAGLELSRRYLISEIKTGDILNNATATQRYLANQLKNYPHEVFACLFLDNQHRLIQYEELVHGTLTEAAIYPREVMKRCLSHNAACIILAHNHPSGSPVPSKADREITQLLKHALALIDIKVIDHIVIGTDQSLSFAELGLL